MRNVMREIDVPDWQERLAAYLPQEDSERRDLQEVLQAVRQDGSRVLYRERQNGHITCSGFVMDPTLSEVLMVYHNIYDSFAWTGGHADGVNDFLAVAVREAKEETGIRKPYAQSGEILSVDVLPVKAHRKHGVSVPAHVHYNITYGLIASKKEKLRVKPDENQAVRWIPMAQLRELCREPQMIPIYEKLAERMRRCARRQEQAAAGVVSQPCTGTALAAESGAVSGLAVGDHVAADPCGGGERLLPAVSGAVSHSAGTGGIVAGAGQQVLGGAGLLQPCSEPPAGCGAAGGAVSGTVSPHVERGAGTPRRGGLYRRRYLFHLL